MKIKLISLLVALMLPASIAFGLSYGNTVSTTYGSYVENSAHFDGPDGVMVGSQVIEDSAAVNGGIILGKGQLMVQSPTFNPTLVWMSPEKASGSAYGTFTITTYTTTTNALLAPTTNLVLAQSHYTDVITPRNLVFLASSTYAGTNMYVKSSALVTGVDCFGNTTTETINFSTATGCAGYTGIGNKAWSSVTSVTITNSSCTVGNVAVLTYYMGSGNKLGCPSQLDSTSEVLKMNENLLLITSGTYSTTYQTYTPATNPNGAVNYWLLVNPKMR